MGSALTKAASGVGVALGNVFLAPVKTIFGASCEGICSGTWDITCFIEHLCVSSLLRLLLALVLTYIVMMFIYLLFQVGIIQCIGRNICKMSWAACHAYCTALEQIGWFCWHKIKNTKRVYRRRRFEDMEEGYGSSDYSSSSDDDDEYLHWRNKLRAHRSVKERKKDQMRKYLHPVRQSSKRSRKQSGGSHHHVRLKTSEVSVHVKGTRRTRSPRRLQLAKRTRTNANGLFSRRRIL